MIIAVLEHELGILCESVYDIKEADPASRDVSATNNHEWRRHKAGGKNSPIDPAERCLEWDECSPRGLFGEALGEETKTDAATCMLVMDDGEDQDPDISGSW